MWNACVDLNGTTYGGRSEYCAVQNYTQLTMRFIGDSKSNDTSMAAACKALKGTSFGSGDQTQDPLIKHDPNPETYSVDQYCAVQGSWTQLSTRLTKPFKRVSGTVNSEQKGIEQYLVGESNAISTSMENACKTIKGTSFGSVKQYCAVQGYTQLSSRLADDPASQNYDMANQCKALKGTSFGSNNQFCAVPGYWTQLSTREPGDPLKHEQSMATACTNLKGTSFGFDERYCAVQGSWAQLSTREHGDGGGGPSLESACTTIKGTSYGKNKEYCAIQGYTQLSTILIGNSAPITSAPPLRFDACDALKGISYRTGLYDHNTKCAVPGVWTQLSSWKTMATECKALKGTSFGTERNPDWQASSTRRDQFCAVQGSWTQLSTQYASLLTQGSTGGGNLGDMCTASTLNLHSGVRSLLEGTSFGKHGQFCAVQNSPPNSASDGGSSSDGDNTLIIILIVCGVLVGLVLLGAAVYAFSGSQSKTFQAFKDEEAVTPAKDEEAATQDAPDSAKNVPSMVLKTSGSMKDKAKDSEA
jgi:hypothetical protein